MSSSIGLCWSCTPAADAVVVGLSLVFLALVLVILYSSNCQGYKHATDLTITQVRGLNKQYSLKVFSNLHRET
ncbi:hypothetical protein PEX1_087210 [Penicillium expansum]|uniref:Uncharacterized protein n=1 Tax=Penicillium expansum TaxID=27334 RepID=A0A0A2IV55_PENEN|nr:hypothetical protein PEX2_057870 [Penicillium expansum]KGO40092.1 hypothetical protein PEXP_034760 [Penicillium expansum]KGO46348.1 hypothetical protein PEX1_087210 [Penicillium expansum]KGO53144.1 hypothetical protein PEX2_057870 [Penicillium expansum]